MANTGFQTVYNNTALEPKHCVKLCIGNLKFGEMEFGEMKRNTSNWSNFGILVCRAGLTATAGLSCLSLTVNISKRIASRSVAFSDVDWRFTVCVFVFAVSCHGLVVEPARKFHVTGQAGAWVPACVWCYWIRLSGELMEIVRNIEFVRQRRKNILELINCETVV